jgi:FemAB-related protein (PEP-CTERM system-associated)
MQVVELERQGKEGWDECVRRVPGATVYHLASWKEVMEQTYGLKTHYLLAKEAGQVLGVLPLLHIKSRLAGHYLTSPPGGLCCQDEAAAATLLQQAKGLVRSAGAGYLILRDSYRRWELPELVTNEDHCTMVARLSPDWELVLKGIKRKERQLSSQGMRAGVQVVSSNGSEGPPSVRLLEGFYPAYSRAMRDKGTPTPGIRFFRNVMERFPTHMILMVVRREPQVLGGGLIAPFRDTVYCAWAGMRREFYELRPSHLLYWETMRYGSANGFQWVDFGRSHWNSGSFEFKRSWGGQPRPLYQQFFLNTTAHPPAVGGSREDDAQYRLFVRLWRHLPLRLTDVLGPQLRKRMPFG